MTNGKQRTANIVLAIVGLKVVNSTFVILLGISVNIGLTFFKCPTIANTFPVSGNPWNRKSNINMTRLNPLPTIEFKTAESFETWLERHHDNSNGLWLKIFKKDSGKKTISYAEALDVALCYGWIDGQKNAYDEQAYLQKFCPRREKSIWSKINIGHVERLTNEGRMRPSGLKAVEKAKEDGRWEKAYDSPSKMTIPEDFLKELSKNKKAEEFFKGLNKTNLFFIGFRLQTAKKQETREKRMKEIIEKLAKDEKFQ